MVMMVVMVVALFFLSVHGDAHMRACDAAFHALFGFEGNTGDPEAAHFVQECFFLFVSEQFVKSRREHISRRAHAEIQI